MWTPSPYHFEAIVKYRKMKNQGVVAVFKRDRFDRYSNFARIGDGSLGGKGRGLAFIDNMVKRHPEFDEFENARVAIPKTVVLCTDVFDEFMDTNNLYQIALSDADDDLILRYFLKAKLPDRLVEDFFTFFDVVKSPIAIRSSSLLEDSHYSRPVCRDYNTYMIPYLDDRYEMLRMLSDAIKGVYASVYFRDSKAYMQATSNVIDQERWQSSCRKLWEINTETVTTRLCPAWHVRSIIIPWEMKSRRRHGEPGSWIRKIYCRRRYDAPFLSLSPESSVANQ